MSEPILMGYPITLLALYFFFYSFLGWVMETCYCSILERRLVPRGFLYGPICPIYGVGVLLMILFFRPLAQNVFLFYVTAVVVMSAWEYLVGWLLEVTTHTKYWDYSSIRFNLHGRICLPISLTWGALSYVIIFLIHPHTEQLFSRIAPWLVHVLCGLATGVLISDATLTIHQLALVSKLTKSVSRAGESLQLQLALGKAQLGDRLDSAAGELRARYNEQVHRLERHTRRLRRHYAHMSFNPSYQIRLDDIRAAAELAKEELRRTRAERQAERERRRAQRRGR